MKYERFEQLPVWQAAIDLAAAVYVMTDKPPFRRRYSLRDQIERAAVWISQQTDPMSYEVSEPIQNSPFEKSPLRPGVGWRIRRIL